MNNNQIDSILQRALNSEKDVDLQALLEEKLALYDLSKTKVIHLLGIDKDTFDDIISGNPKQPTLVNVIKIAQFLDISIEDAIPAILKNQHSDTFASLEKAKKVTFVAKNFDIKKLSKIGFLNDSKDIDHVIERLLTFFGYESILEYESNLSAPLFSKTKRQYVDKMKDFWIKSAYRSFIEINNPNDYDRERLKDIIINLKPYCQDIKDGLFTVSKALYGVGVTVIFQEQLITTQVRGGTFVVNNKPCIVLTDLNKKYTTIWETLIHELHHVLYDLDKIKSTNFHITGDPDLFLIEERADDFSREYFCGIDKYKYISPHIKNHFLVSKFARDMEVHPSFIYSSFQFFQDKLHKKNYWGAFREYQPDYKLAINSLHPITWKEESLSAIAFDIKQIFELNK